MELGHLYDDTGDYRALIMVAIQLELSSRYLQRGEFVHFDLWGKPLIRAKELYTIATDLELAEDMERLNSR